ncbi:hypothetical protein COV19_02165 [Candidatus Woesearchaeota archaeon CG10_big_fil_rev_8_21_14_0_10_44_13]|nr:MAG: hypothetical protein COV19_02165 [Candidatus Woesearchaeota archaeon CG10_big_fil_rev_8_21_14_0_10_44_13]
MFVKKGEEKACWLQCSRTELFHEFLFQLTAVFEGIGDDANLLVYDVAVELREIALPIISKTERPKRVIYSLYYSLYLSFKNVPRLSAALYNLILLK